MDVQEPGAAVPRGTGAAPDASQDISRRRTRATIIGSTAAVLIAVGFVAYAVEISRAVPTAKYANLVLSPSPAQVPRFGPLARLGGGAPITASVFTGGPTVVNWFRSPCVACQAELGTFASVAREERGKLRVLGVDIDDPSPTTALAMIRRAKADYPVAEAPGAAYQSFASRFGVYATPTTVFISAGGKVLGEVLGNVPRAELSSLFANLAAGRSLNS